MTKKFVYLFFVLIFGVFSSIGSAQQHPQHAAVMIVVDQFFEALNTNNQDLMAQISIDGSMNYSIREREDKSFQLNSRHVDNSERQANRPKFTERYWDEIVLIDEHMAVFWAPYDFYIEGEFSHCGIDVFDLINIEGQWKLANTMYTIIRTGCPTSPLGPL